MKKTVLCSIFAVACIASPVLALVFQGRLNFAEEHYENFYAIVTIDGKYSLTELMGGTNHKYGCGEASCKYCNGAKRKDNMVDIAYYKTNLTYMVVSYVSAVVFGGLFVKDCIVPMVLEQKAKNKEE